MKANILRSLVLFVGLSGALVVPVADSWAQKTSSAAPITVIKVKNVRAKVMESWVAPRKKIAPGLRNEDKKPNQNSLSMSDGVEGLESVVANEAQNELWVKGTPESIRQLKDIIEFVDKPIRQLELKTQIVEVDAAEVAGLGKITDSPGEKVTNPATGQQNLVFKAGGQQELVFKAEFQDKIKGLIAASKARVLHASQTTASNNSTARVSWDENPISQRIALRVTPTIQHDKTITLFLTRIIGEGEVSEGKITATSFITTVANIRDDIIVLRLNDFETVSSKDSERVTLLLASARILEE